jgi:hypothetical protein
MHNFKIFPEKIPNDIFSRAAVLDQSVPPQLMLVVCLPIRAPKYQIFRADNNKHVLTVLGPAGYGFNGLAVTIGHRTAARHNTAGATRAITQRELPQFEFGATHQGRREFARSWPESYTAGSLD